MSALINAVASLAVLPSMIGFGSIHYTDNTTRVQLSEYVMYDNINNLASEGANLHTLGKTYYSSKQICISSDAKESDKERILYHEIGHVIDEKNGNHGMYSSTPDFLKCFNDEKYHLQSCSKEYYFTDKPEEYFAECYSLFVLSPNKLQKYGRGTYDYFKKIIGERSKLSDSDLKKRIDELIEQRKNSPMNNISLDGILPSK